MSTQIRRVVVGVSESLAGLEALRVAVAEARQRDVHLVAVRAWSYKATTREPGVARWRREISSQAVQALTRAFTTAMGGPPADVPTELIVAEGMPEKVLVAQADRPDDLLVIGAPSDGFWWPTRTLVVRRCVRRTRCQVLVVPPPELARLGKTGAMARILRRETEGFTRTMARH
jgi:nucleotide-binding universal stress UspA family protein